MMEPGLPPLLNRANAQLSRAAVSLAHRLGGSVDMAEWMLSVPVEGGILRLRIERLDEPVTVGADIQWPR
jgi:hypothetical protein